MAHYRGYPGPPLDMVEKRQQDPPSGPSSGTPQNRKRYRDEDDQYSSGGPPRHAPFRRPPRYSGGGGGSHNQSPYRNEQRAPFKEDFWKLGEPEQAFVLAPVSSPAVANFSRANPTHNATTATFHKLRKIIPDVFGRNDSSRSDIFEAFAVASVSTIKVFAVKLNTVLQRD